MKRAVSLLLMMLPMANLLAAPGNEGQYRWQSAPSEQLQAQLTIKEAILRAFARKPKNRPGLRADPRRPGES